MAVPKSKQSKQRTNTRYAKFKAAAPSLVECPHCHELKQPHKACPKCGFYKDKEVIKVEESK